MKCMVKNDSVQTIILVDIMKNLVSKPKTCFESNRQIVKGGIVCLK